MSNNKRNLLTSLLTAAGAGIICIVVLHRSRILKGLRYALDFRNPLRHRQIKVVETIEDCQNVVSTLKRHIIDYKVLGFDCEWVTVGGTRRPTALLQLSSHQGLCALFRLCHLQQIPKSLRELLEDDDVIKVGVGPQDDAQKLAHDFGVGVASTFDLRFLAAMTGHKAEGLAKLSKAILNVQLDKNWRLVCSDWESKELNDKQLYYAANDALVAVEIFYKLAVELEPRNFWQIYNYDFESIKTRLEPFFEVRFKEGFINNILSTKFNASLDNANKKCGRNWGTNKIQSRGICTRSRVQYDNCLLEAPDSELLCTIDRKKAQWYLDQNLGERVKDDPFTVRLKFEPAGRAVGEVGRYYQTPKENQCVVCGWRDAYIRKNVVPREYRKHFPVVMKSHTSHDVLLLCPHCHQLSNISDLKIRIKLAQLCDAPLANEGANKYVEILELKQLRSAARALLQNGEKIPAERKEHLKQIVLNHYPLKNDLTLSILEEAANIETYLDNENFCQHGEKVVKKFQTELGGLIELEKLWREHFLQTMKPKFLPPLWNVNHNANRLEIRAHEGRIDKDDLILAGLDPLASSQVQVQVQSK